jgi:uncharacterized YigZ family protein
LTSSGGSDAPGASEAPGASPLKGGGDSTAGGGTGRPPGSRYPVPAGVHRAEEEIRRSRFITTLAPAPGETEARNFVASVRAEFPDATHTCWAYVAGPPGSTACVGMSDDGEPQGTAGRPMLKALLHAGVGEVVATVTRFYGGVRLGRGGLQRAYGGGVQRALETLPRGERVHRHGFRIVVDYSALEPLRRALGKLDGVIRGESFGADVELRVEVPAGAEASLHREVAALTSGQGRVTCLPEADG